MLLTDKYKNIVVQCPFCNAITSYFSIKRHLRSKTCMTQQQIISKTDNTLYDEFTVYLNALKRVCQNAKQFGNLKEDDERYQIVSDAIDKLQIMKTKIYTRN